MKLPNIRFVNDEKRLIEAKDDWYSYIIFNKDDEYFENNTNYKFYIKECEKTIRASDDYKDYISWIKGTLGINFCQVMSKIKSSKNVTVEMHHGPIFTLYDCVECAIEYRLCNHLPVTTFRVADQVLEDHYNLIIQTVMLCKTMHEGAHNRDIFLNSHQIIGNLEGFFDKYSPYFSDRHKYNLYINLKMSEKNPSYDNGILDTEHIKPYFKEVEPIY